MSFVTAEPEMMMAAACDLQTVGATMVVQNEAAAGPTTGIVPAAADAVSVLTAAQFAAYGARYQELGAQAAAIHELLVTTLGASAGSYAAAEAANTATVG